MATRKRPSQVVVALTLWADQGDGQKVKAAVGVVLTLELTAATGLPACLRALLTPFRPATRDLAAEAGKVKTLQVALSEPARHQLRNGGTDPPIDTGDCSEQQLAWHREIMISTAR